MIITCLKYLDSSGDDEIVKYEWFRSVIDAHTRLNELKRLSEQVRNLWPPKGFETIEWTTTDELVDQLNKKLNFVIR